MNHALFLNVSERCFFFCGVYLLLLLLIFISFLFYCLITSFNNKNNYFFADEYMHLVIKAKRMQLIHSSVA